MMFSLLLSTLCVLDLVSYNLTYLRRHGSPVNQIMASIVVGYQSDSLINVSVKIDPGIIKLSLKPADCCMHIIELTV